MLRLLVVTSSLFIVAAVVPMLACGPTESASTEGETGTGECPVGSFGCSCTPGGGCDDGLECSVGMCLAPSGTSEASSGGATGTSGVADETGTGSTTTSAITTSTTTTGSTNDSGTDSTSGGAESSDSGTGSRSDWWDPAWTRRVRITFDNAAQAEDLVDFPVLLVLDPGRIDYASTLPGGADLRVVDADGSTVLPHEIEGWTPGSDSFVWASVPQIDGSSDTDEAWIYFGNPAAADGQDGNAVWNADYRAVWHLATDLDDSTSNANDVTNLGTVAGTGRIGGGREFNGAGAHLQRDNSVGLNLGDAELTLEAWVMPQASSGFRPVVGKREAGQRGYNLNYNAGTMFLGKTGVGEVYGGVQMSNNLWQHVAVTWNSATDEVRHYRDGLLVTTVVDAADINVPIDEDDVQIGGDGIAAFWEGTIDEPRISAAQRSPDWIAAQYASMIDAFVSYDPVEIAP